jgi:hypothetical protein
LISTELFTVTQRSNFVQLDGSLHFVVHHQRGDRFLFACRFETLENFEDFFYGIEHKE